MMEDHYNIKTKKKILAAVGIVWEVLLDPTYTQQWVSAFSEGEWIEAEWKKGGLVIWKDKNGEVTAKGIVRALERNQLIQVDYFDDKDLNDTNTQTGKYQEIFNLFSIEGKTLLVIEAGPLSEKDAKDHEVLWDKALEKIKSLAEADYGGGYIA